MTVGELIEYRRMLGLTQAQMARAMHIGSRAYFDVEAQDRDAELNGRHVALLERYSLSEAIERRNLSVALPAIRREARAFMDLFDGRPLERIFANLPG